MNDNDRNTTTGSRLSRRIAACVMAGMMIVAFAGCSTTGNTASAATMADAATAAEVMGTAASTDYYVNAKAIDTDDMFTDRDLAGTWDEAEAETITLADGASKSSSDSVKIDGDTVTITGEGTYVVSGSLGDGQIQVEAADDAKIQIVLNGVEITNDDAAAIYVKSAKKVFVTAAEGSENTLTAGAVNTSSDSTESKVDGVIYSKEDLTLNGTGTLTIKASAGHGIVANDDLVLAGLTLKVDASKKAIKAHNSVRIASGTYELTAGTDGIHAKDADKGVGFVYIADGTVTINAGDDGIHAHTDLIIDGGTINVAKSNEGLEGNTVTIHGGDVDVLSTDDGINAAAGKTTSSDTSAKAGFGKDGSSGSDGSDQNAAQKNDDSNQSADGSADQNGNGKGSTDGSTDQNTGKGGHKGFKGQKPDGERPDGAPGGSGRTFGKGGFGGMGGRGDFGGMNEQDDSCLIVITGGTVHVNAEGDGIDSNGSIEIAGGKTYVEGPTNSGNGSLDVGGQGSATITGGYFIATGSSGMAVQFSDQSTQGCILVDVDQTSGTATLADADGKALISQSSDKNYTCVQVSTPQISKGSTYTLKAGDSEQTITMDADSLIYGQASGMGGFGGKGGFGGSNDQTDKNGSGNQTDQNSSNAQDGKNAQGTDNSQKNEKGGSDQNDQLVDNNQTIESTQEL